APAHVAVVVVEVGDGMRAAQRGGRWIGDVAVDVGGDHGDRIACVVLQFRAVVGVGEVVAGPGHRVGRAAVGRLSRRNDVHVVGADLLRRVAGRPGDAQVEVASGDVEVGGRLWLGESEAGVGRAGADLRPGGEAGRELILHAGDGGERVCGGARR